MDWFLYDNSLRHERVKMKSDTYFQNTKTVQKGSYMLSYGVPDTK